MSLNIKNERVHDLVRELAQITGQSQTSAVEDAVRRRLAELTGAEERDRDARRAAIDRAIDEIQRLPVVGPAYEEMMADMYDEMGLPR